MRDRGPRVHKLSVLPHPLRAGRARRLPCACRCPVAVRSCGSAPSPSAGTPHAAGGWSSRSDKGRPTSTAPPTHQHA
eukprot:scaffold2915_cov282-Prasinococcus_capsulatus_cf.AAC.3